MTSEGSEDEGCKEPLNVVIVSTARSAQVGQSIDVRTREGRRLAIGIDAWCDAQETGSQCPHTGKTGRFTEEPDGRRLHGNPRERLSCETRQDRPTIRAEERVLPIYRL